MAKTLGSAASAFKGKSIKFLDDGSSPMDGEDGELESDDSGIDSDEIEENSEGEEIENSQDEEVESDSDSDSDSDAPEEESTSVAKQETIEKLKQEKQRQQDLRRQEREKRKQRDVQLKLQLEARKERIRELASAEELPDFLPEEVLEPEEPQSLGKHIRLEELEKEHAESRKRAKLEKLLQIKELRKQAINKGPVHVQVQTFDLTKRTVPRAEASVLETKNSWLQRASLGKK